MIHPIDNPIQVNGSKELFEAFALLKANGLRCDWMEANCNSKKRPWVDRSAARYLIHWTQDQEQKILSLGITPGA